MKTNFFADVAKNRCETCETCEIEELPRKNNNLNSRAVSQSECEANVRNVRRTDSEKVLPANLTTLTFQRETNVRSCETEKANSDSNLASVSQISHFSHQKTDNSASSRVEFFFGGPYRLNIGGRTQLVWLPEGLETAEVLQRAKAMYPGVEVSDQPPPQGWPILADIPEMPKAGTPQPVEAWTSSGRKVFVTAYSAEHAAAIQRMNPPPTSAADDEGWVDVDDLEVRP